MLHAQDVSASQITYGQGIDALPGPGGKAALQINRPDVIDAPARKAAAQTPRRAGPGTPLGWLDQA
jgi:hypothetical protein